jgi:hypothetical protein
MTYDVYIRETANSKWRANGIKESNYAAACVVWATIAAKHRLAGFKLVPSK